MNLHQLLYGGCILLTGLLGGLFYGYQCSVINGLGRLTDKEYIAAFQNINKAIINPVFFLSFGGSLVLLLLTTYTYYRAGVNQYLPFLVASSIIYGVGVLAITIIYNVPLNEQLGKFNISDATISQIQDARSRFEQSWNTWHLVRTIASIISFTLLIIPLIKGIHR